MSNNLLRVALLCTATALTALADPVITYGGIAAGSDGYKSSVAGTTTIDFNSGFTFNTPISVGGGTVSYASTGAGPHIVTGDLSGVYAAPTGDTTPYLTLGPSAGTPITITSSTGLNYFGFYLSTGDTYNELRFYNGATLLYTLNGSQFSNPANGTTSSYVNIRTSKLFDRIEMSSNQNAFETDNHAFGTVPEPGVLSMFGLLGVGTLALRRRRN